MTLPLSYVAPGNANQLGLGATAVVIIVLVLTGTISAIYLAGPAGAGVIVWVLREVKAIIVTMAGATSA